MHKTKKKEMKKNSREKLIFSQEFTLLGIYIFYPEKLLKCLKTVNIEIWKPFKNDNEKIISVKAFKLIRLTI